MLTYEDTYGPIFLTTLQANYEGIVKEAAHLTGFSIFTTKNSIYDDQIAVFTNEEISKDHEPFWKKFEELKETIK